jgi:predicted lipoprotein with Yx(FWY)xxD motif
MRSTFILGVLVVLYAAPVVAQDGATIQVATSEKYGEYLTDADGRPVYLFTTDKPAGADAAEISCTSEECLNAWPLVTSSGEPQAGGIADASLIGTINYEGKTVVTYNRWPLYYFVKDEGAGEPQGHDIESFGGEWYLVQPSGEKVEHEG